MSIFFTRLWYQEKVKFLSILLLPIAFIFGLVIRLRRLFYKSFRKKSTALPVIVVGNITLGGAGKTPLVILIYQKLVQLGYKPAVISRGYKRQSSERLLVCDESTSKLVGDEPLMIYQTLKCPVAVAKKRLKALDLIHQCFPEVDVIISDDGLQHYQMPRKVEILVIDAKRQLGNRLLFPAGPLREKPTRINEVNFVVYNGVPQLPVINHYDVMMLKPTKLINLKTGISHNPDDLISKCIYAVAGIGNPERFFQTLVKIGYKIIEKPFPDHYQYKKSDLEFEQHLPIIMTKKDAIKCQFINNDNCWYLDIEAEIDNVFFEKLVNALN